MPTLRDRAARRTVIATRHVEQKFDPKWSLTDKRKLLAALRKHDPENLNAIRSEFLPNRSDKELTWFIERMRSKGLQLKYTEQASLARRRVPIEVWLQTAEDLTRNQTDYSFALSHVFSLIADKELHDPKVSPFDPDWKLIYSYIVAALRGYELPQVGQIEAALLLDLIERLTLRLKAIDSLDQRWLMKRKYELLARRTDPSLAAQHDAQRALYEDLIETERNRPDSIASSSNADLHSTNQTSPTPAVSTSVPPTASSSPLVCDPSTSHAHKNPVGRPRKRRAGECDRSTCEFVSKQQKEPMYTFNPFCIPVKYLNPRLNPPAAAATPGVIVTPKRGRVVAVASHKGAGAGLGGAAANHGGVVATRVVSGTNGGVRERSEHGVQSLVAGGEMGGAENRPGDARDGPDYVRNGPSDVITGPGDVISGPGDVINMPADNSGSTNAKIEPSDASNGTVA